MKQGYSRRKRHSFPAPEWSLCVYVAIDASLVHMFRFLLEAHDNLAIMSVVDRWKASLKIRFSPHQQKQVMETLAEMQQTVPFDIVSLTTHENHKSE